MGGFSCSVLDDNCSTVVKFETLTQHFFLDFLRKDVEIEKYTPKIYCISSVRKGFLNFLEPLLIFDLLFFLAKIKSVTCTFRKADLNRNIQTEGV